jgi:fatty acid desaturase
MYRSSSLRSTWSRTTSPTCLTRCNMLLAFFICTTYQEQLQRPPTYTSPKHFEPRVEQTKCGLPALRSIVFDRDFDRDSSPPMAAASVHDVYHPFWRVGPYIVDLDRLKHPGGRDVIDFARGRDVSDIFVLSHSFSKSHREAATDATKLKEYLAPYIVSVVPGADVNVPLTPRGGLWDDLVGTIQAMGYTRRNSKASSLGYLKLAAMVALWFGLYFFACSTGSFIAAFAAGLFSFMFGFCGMHDASHSAISVKPWVNSTIAHIWAFLMNFHSYIWYVHHVLGHHGHTGDFDHDPDMIHSAVIIRKHIKIGARPLHFLQNWLPYIMMLVFPNQKVAMGMQYYLKGFRNRRMWREKLPLARNVNALDVFCFFAGLVMSFVYPFFCLSPLNALGVVFFFSMAQATSYFLNVAPNHDTISTRLNEDNSRPDVAERQVRNSGDFFLHDSILGRIWAMAFGSMNFQIEHHLFPTMGHEHLPRIAPVVETLCKKHNVPYVAHTSIVSAMQDFHRTLVHYKPSATEKQGAKRSGAAALSG